ncbi:MAG: hypothetical protein RIQ62_920 [Bacteroidota bacterium]|jgi:hypothetical protein
MKQILAFLLLCLYLLPSLGVWGNIHYCGKKICRIDILTEAKVDNCCGGKPMKSDCCKDKKFSVKKSGQERSGNMIEKTFSPIFAIPEALAFKTADWIHYPCKQVRLADYHPPPPDVKHPIYISHRCFRM